MPCTLASPLSFQVSPRREAAEELFLSFSSSLALLVLIDRWAFELLFKRPGQFRFASKGLDWVEPSGFGPFPASCSLALPSYYSSGLQTYLSLPRVALTVPHLA